MGEICPRSNPDIAHMKYSIYPLKLILDYLNFPMFNPHRQDCKYGPHLSEWTVVAGEMTIFPKIAMDLDQLAYRMEMLKLASYYYKSVTMEGIRSFYRSILEDIEKGIIDWGDKRELDKAEARFLLNPDYKRRKDNPNFRTSKPSDKTYYCSDFNLGKCSKSDKHEGKVGDHTVTVSHICRACFVNDRLNKPQSEKDSACPHKKSEWLKTEMYATQTPTIHKPVAKEAILTS